MISFKHAMHVSPKYASEIHQICHIQNQNIKYLLIQHQSSLHTENQLLVTQQKYYYFNHSEAEFRYGANPKTA